VGAAGAAARAAAVGGRPVVVWAWATCLHAAGKGGRWWSQRQRAGKDEAEESGQAREAAGHMEYAGSNSS